jgi:hypothetical protein
MSDDIISADARRSWTCIICKRAGVWNEQWSWYGSILESEDTGARAVMCSPACAAKFKPSRWLKKVGWKP